MDMISSILAGGSITLFVITLTKGTPEDFRNRFKDFRNKLSIFFIELIDKKEISKLSRDDKLDFFQKEVYPLLAMTGRIDSWFFGMPGKRNLLSIFFLISLFMFIGTILFPINLEMIYVNYLPIFLWGLGLVFFGFSLYMLIFMKRNIEDMDNEITKIEMGKITVEDFVNENKKRYEKMLRKAYLFFD